MEADDEQPVAIPITGELDLHTFTPRELVQVIDAYFEACRERSIFVVRVIHGKGTGALRRTVQSHLRRHPGVLSFRTADAGEGGWGATRVELRR